MGDVRLMCRSLLAMLATNPETTKQSLSLETFLFEQLESAFMFFRMEGWCLTAATVLRIASGVDASPMASKQLSQLCPVVGTMRLRRFGQCHLAGKALCFVYFKDVLKNSTCCQLRCFESQIRLRSWVHVHLITFALPKIASYLSSKPLEANRPARLQGKLPSVKFEIKASSRPLGAEADN